MSNTTLQRAKKFVLNDPNSGAHPLVEAWIEKMAEFAESENAQLREKLALSKDALKMALRVIDDLHEQQAMEDNSFLTQREIVGQALAIIDGNDALKERVE